MTLDYLKQLQTTHTVTLSNGLEVEYRPYTVKEEKALLMVADSKDESRMADMMLQSVQACVMTKGVVCEDLPSYDFEKLFISIRASSVGETITISTKCEKDECGQSFDVEVDLTEAELTEDRNEKPNIEVAPGFVLTMIPPSFKAVRKTIKDRSDDSDTASMNQNIEIVASCIDSVALGDGSIRTRKMFEPGEDVALIEAMNTQQLKKVVTYFEGLPKLRYEKTIKCPKCGHEQKLVVEGATNFFG
jgi:hypothetical protein